MDERADPVSAGESTSAIRDDIERTQREMSHTIDEIQYRLSPAHLKEQAKERVRRASVRTSRNTIDRVKSNPIGAAMVGIGLWMLLRNNDSDDDVYYLDRDFDRGHDHDPHSHTYSPHTEHRDFSYGDDRGRMAEVKDRAGDVAERVGERVSELRDETFDRAQALRDRTMDGARNIKMRGRDVLNDTPLVAGIAAVALGALVGAMIPETERENELFGQTRDKLKDRAADVAREGVGQAKNIATAAATAARDAAKEATTKAKDEMTNTNATDEISI